MDRLEAFETMLSDIKAQAQYEEEQLEKLKAAGKEKSVTYRQLYAHKMTFRMILDKYRQYGLVD